MMITVCLIVYFTTTFHSAILYNVFNVKKSPILNTIYFIYNRSSFTLLVSWLILQNYPNGEPSKKEEVKKWYKSLFCRKRNDRKEIGQQNMLDGLVDDLNKNINGSDDQSNDNYCENYCEKLRSKGASQLKVYNETAKRKISSSESTSDLSDHLNEECFAELISDKKLQDTNNNPVFDFYDKKLINFDTEPVKKDKKTEDNKTNLSKKDEPKSRENKKQDSKQTRPSSILIWIRLDRSIYYSHFFYLIYSLFNVNHAQESDLVSMMISVHCKIFWAYMLAYVFHLLIEKPISNLTHKLMQMLPIENDVKYTKID